MPEPSGQQDAKRFIQVQVTDEAARRIADGLQAVDLHAEACCIQVLLRDRSDAETRASLLEGAVRHVVQHGKLGKQSERRLRAAVFAVEVSRG